MTIIAFDLSLSNTGYSIFEDDGKFIRTGYIETNKDEITPQRLRKISKEMKKLRKIKPSKIIIEKGFFRYAGSSEQIWRVHGITNLIFYDIEQIEIHATSVRKLVAGRGNMKKEEMRDFISRKYPHVVFENLDEVDSFALGIAHFKREGIL